MLACVFALIAIMAGLLAVPPKKDAVAVSFLHWTNSWPRETKMFTVYQTNGTPITFIREPGRKQILFEVSNGLPRHIWFQAYMFTGAVHHAKARTVQRAPYYDSAMAPDGASPAAPGGAEAGATFRFILDAPPKDVPFFVRWEIDKPPPETRLEKFQDACCTFLGAHGMSRLGNRFLPTPGVHYIPSTDIRE